MSSLPATYSAEFSISDIVKHLGAGSVNENEEDEEEEDEEYIAVSEGWNEKDDEEAAACWAISAMSPASWRQSKNF